MATEILLKQYGKELLPLTRADGCSCLHISVYMGYENVFKLLLHASKEAGVESAMLSMTTVDGSSCLFVSVQMGYPSITRKLIEEGGAKLLAMKRKDGTSCLAVVRNNLMRLGSYCAAKLKCQHTQVLTIVEKACLRYGVELE